MYLFDTYAFREQVTSGARAGRRAAPGNLHPFDAPHWKGPPADIPGESERSGPTRGMRLIAGMRLWYSARFLGGPGVARGDQAVINTDVRSPSAFGEDSVARSCDVCGKSTVYGNRISHANNVSSRAWYPNIQRVRVTVGRSRRRIKACTRCIRSGAIVKAAS